MNYSIPVTRISSSSKDKEYKQQKNKYNKEDLNDILNQQIIICQLSSGISFEDTNNMDEYERIYVINKLIELKKEENEAKKKALDNAKNKK